MSEVPANNIKQKWVETLKAGGEVVVANQEMPGIGVVSYSVFNFDGSNFECLVDVMESEFEDATQQRIDLLTSMNPDMGFYLRISYETGIPEICSYATES